MLEISHLTKRYGDHLALSDLTCTIEQGKIYGLLGPNGAGKSTTMNIITGCLSATSGTATIDGYDIFEEPEEAKKRIGYLPEFPPLYTDMTPLEYLDFVARAKGVPAGQLKGQIQQAMEVTQLEPMKNRLCRNLSKGYKQRVGIAQALLGEPKLIILDEPTVGLDPKQIIEIRELIHDLGKEHTVMLSSHILSEVRSVCDQVLILSHGKLAASDTPDHLEQLFASLNTIDLTVRASEAVLRQALSAVIPPERLRIIEENDGLLRCAVTVNQAEDMREQIFFALAEAKTPLLEMVQARTSLEDVFLELTEDMGAEQDPVAGDIAAEITEEIKEVEA